MKQSFEETLIAVRRQALVDEADTRSWVQSVTPSPEAKLNVFDKLRSSSTETQLWGLNKTPKPNRDGLRWRERGRK
jgi:hypothetical protein